MKKLITIICLIALPLAGAAQARLGDTSPEDVLRSMTLEEKAALLVGSQNHYEPGHEATSSSSNVLKGAAGTTSSIERLGIPATVLADGPAGLRIDPVREGDSRTYYCTAFPVETALASSWDVALVRSVGEAMGNEVLEYGADVLLAPGVNIQRNPLCGRNFEYYSEDPVVSGKIASAFVRGIQSQGVGTSVKHFAANNQETKRMENDSRVSVRALREIYLRGFETIVREAQPWTVMSSYNKLNGRFTQADKELLTDLLRGEWGFDGIVMTDWTWTRNTAAQVAAGNDLLEPGNREQVNGIIAAVRSGELSEEALDACVLRMLRYVMKTPAFRKYEFSSAPDLKSHAELVRKAAAECMVLLKNDNDALPFDGVGKIALFGAPAYEMIAGGNGSGYVHKPYMVSLDAGLKNAGLSLDGELVSYYGSYAKSCYRRWRREGFVKSIWNIRALPEPQTSSSAVWRAAAENDAAVVVIARTSGESKDRQIEQGDWYLTDNEMNLLRDVCDSFHARGKRVTVVLNVGGVIETASWKHFPDAILLAWQPGQEAGNSVADVLVGKANPSGRLAATFPENYFDDPSSFNFPYGNGKYNRSSLDYTDYDEGIYVGYRWFSTYGKRVSFPFGYGLSYTEFEQTEPSVKVKADSVFFSVRVKNVGNVAGKDVAEVFVSAPESPVLDKPKVELKAFAKTGLLAPGESEVLTMGIAVRDLASFDEVASAWRADAGKYVARFCRDAETELCSRTFRLKKTYTEKCRDILRRDRPVQN